MKIFQSFHIESKSSWSNSNKKISDWKPKQAFCRDIPHYEKNPYRELKINPDWKFWLKINPDPQDFMIFGTSHSGFFQAFLEIFAGFSKSDPDCRDFRDFPLGIFSGFSWPFFGIFKSRTRSMGFWHFGNNRFSIPGI